MSPITILLRTWNAGSDLPPLLDVLGRQSMLPLEILVIDSESTDGTPELAREAGARIVTISKSEFTHARSTNLGFREARGDIVAMLSQDALPADEQWLEKLVAPLDQPEVAAVFGRQIPREACFPLERWELERCYPSSGSPEVLYSNVNSAARRETWLRIPYDESVLIAEDRFWARAVMRDGHRIHYQPSAAVVHSHTYSLGQMYARCRAEARARADQEGERAGLGILLKAWPSQSLRDARRLASEGDLRRWPRAVAYRFAQYTGILAGGRS